MNGIENKISKIKQLKELIKQIKNNFKVANQHIDYQNAFKCQNKSNVNPYILEIVAN